MKKVILRFLRNKAIEIASGLFIALKYATLVVVGLSAVAIVFWFIGWCVGGWELFVELADIEKTEPMFEYYVGLGAIFLMAIILTGCLIGVVYILVFTFIEWFIDWIKENWQRAKEEVGYDIRQSKRIS